MSLPTLHGTGRLTGDPELRFAKSGTAVTTVNLAFNSRRYDRDQGKWVDGDVLFIRATIFGDAAENAAETYQRGMEVVISGRVKLDEWEDKNTGEKRSRAALLVDSIGPSTRSAKAQVVRTGTREQPGDSWPEVKQPATQEEPPF